MSGLMYLWFSCSFSHGYNLALQIQPSTPHSREEEAGRRGKAIPVSCVFFLSGKQTLSPNLLSLNQQAPVMSHGSELVPRAISKCKERWKSKYPAFWAYTIVEGINGKEVWEWLFSSHLTLSSIIPHSFLRSRKQGELISQKQYIDPCVIVGYYVNVMSRHTDENHCTSVGHKKKKNKEHCT